MDDDRAMAFRPAHPGEYLRDDVLPALGMRQAEFARHLGVTPQSVSELLREQRGVTTEMAIRLGKALKNGARFWLALQLQHDLWLAERSFEGKVEPISWNDAGEAA